MGNLSDSPTELEGKNANRRYRLAGKVYAARMRLQSAVDQADALDAIREIAANLNRHRRSCRLQSGQEAIGTLALTGRSASIRTSTRFLK